VEGTEIDFTNLNQRAAKAKKHKLREECDKTQKGALDKYFPKEAVKQEKDFDLVLDSGIACAAKTDNDKSDNDGKEPLTALSSAANSPNFEITGSESGYFENISAENTTGDIGASGGGVPLLWTLRNMSRNTLDLEHLSVVGTSKDSSYTEDSDSHVIKGSGNGAFVFIGDP
jgi:hypothetical protein